MRWGPLLVASVLLIAGFLHYAPGAAYSLSAEHYRAWAFPAFRYSDLIWLYLRDHLERRPIPYVDFPLEYPPLTGAISWLLSWASDLPTYFALVYLVLSFSALAAVWALQRIPGANPWLFAAAPALFFYTGHQWDMAAVGVTALALFALSRNQVAWGVTGLVAATSMKLFPVVFVAALIVERIRDRRFRSAAVIAIGFMAGTAAINLPVALANLDGWAHFIRWNRDRLADSGIWILWRGTPTDDLTRWSLIAAVAGGAALTVIAFRSKGPLTIPLGSTFLLWWLLVNKTFTTHLILWVFLALALLSAPWWIWLLTTAADLVGFQLGNYLNLYNILEYRSAPLIRKAVENIYDPVQIARSAVLLICSLWGLHLLNHDRLRVRYAASSTASPAPLTPPPLISEAASPLPWRRKVALGAGVVLAYVAATAVMLWPYPLHLGDATIVGFDPFLQIWLSEWIHHALTTDPRTLYDANVFYPFAQTLAYTDANLPGALLAAPPRLLGGDPVVTNALLSLATFVIAGSGVYALVAYVSGNRSAGFVAGLAYAFLPYRMVHLWHLNWLEGAWLPWLVLALLRVVERPAPARAVILGIIAGVLLLTSFYFSVQLLIVGGVVLAAAAIARRGALPAELLRAGAVAALVAAVIAVPFYIPYLQVQQEQRLERSVVDAEQYKALPESYLQLAPWDQPSALQRLIGIRAGPNESLSEVGQAAHADGHRHAEIVIEDALFPGLFASAFALAGLIAWRRQRWLAFSLAAIAVIAAVLSLGPTLGPRHGDGPGLPYGVLFDHAPFFRAMRVPARLGGLANLMIVILAGLGLALAWERIRTLPQLSRAGERRLAGATLTLLMSAAVLAELWTGGAPLADVDRAPERAAAAEWLAGQPYGAVMEFPAESVFADPAAASVRRHYGESMYWSTRHWLPLVNGNSGFIPRAYSDFIERFVGEIPRPDGSMTSRISHLDAESARLLRQIGVRYLVFHRSQYREEDWPAVLTRLRILEEDGTIVAAGDHGEATIYVLPPAAPPVEPPAVTLYAPTLLTPESAWGPWFALESPAGTPAVLALTRPPLLETTWFDAEGRRLWQGLQRMPFPVILEEPRLLCGPTECLTSRPLTNLERLPPPDGAGSWRPPDPGHYVVQMRLSGDHPIDCRVDLDLVADAAAVYERSREQRFRWAECIEGHPNPVNNPGALPFALSPPSVTLIDERAVVDIALTPRQDAEVRAWFTLAPPGSTAPWKEAAYQSPMLQELAPAATPTAFEWNLPVGAEVSPGIYDLTVWVHRRGPRGWEHATGGDIGLAPVVVDEDGMLRWAGPVRVRMVEPPRPLRPGATASFVFDVDGASDQIQCQSTWKLMTGTVVAASGNGGSCDRPEVRLPADTPTGQYRLEIDVLAVSEADARLSDAVSLPMVVVDTMGGRPR